MHELDLTTDVERTITIIRNRTLNQRLRSDVYEDGEFLYPFDFSEYTGATLEVRTKANDFNKILTFTTVDGSIVLDNDGIFALIKSADELNVRAGEYYYDMYLTSLTESKRAFMKGKFIIEERITL
jgi:hypothetical protein